MNLWIMSQIWDLDWGLSWWTVVWWGGTLVALLHIPSVLMARGGRPTAVLSWLLALLALPFLGVLLWWVMGRRHIERRKRRWERPHADMMQSLAEVKHTIAHMSQDREMAERPVLSPDGGRRISAGGGGNLLRPADPFSLRSEEGVFAATRGNCVRVSPTGAQAFDAFERAIRRAKNHIHFEFYIWQNDAVGRHFRDLLAEKAREGLEVRVLYDAVGGAPVSRGFMGSLVDAGAKVAAFLPLALFERQLRINFRNHRKLIVIDAQVGFTGGLNIGEEYTRWVDHAFEFEGPAVRQLQEVFAEDWYFATGENLGSPQYFLPVDSPESAEFELLSCEYTADSFRPLPGHEEDALQAETDREEDAHSPTEVRASAENADKSAHQHHGWDGLVASLNASENSDFGRKKERGDVEESNPMAPDDMTFAGIVHDATVRIVASGPDKPHSVIEKIFFMAMTGATERIYLTTPYFVPDQAILMAITTAAMRGVDVRILTAGMTDVWLARQAGRSLYEDLLRAGVRIFEYEDRMLHAKAIVIDRQWSVVGSANMDIRSFRLNFEVNAVIRDAALCTYMADLFSHHLDRSVEIQYDAFCERGYASRFLENTARLFSPLL